jgi:predicted metal-binding membrane protein
VPLRESTSNRTGRLARPHPAFSPARARLSLLLSLGVLTAGAWALTLHQAFVVAEPMGITASGGSAMDGMSMDSMSGMAMTGMPVGGWSLQEAVAFVVMWTVMMAAMMLPAMTPMVLTFAAAQARRTRTMAIPTWIFIAGYLLVWLAAGALVYILVQAGSSVVAHLSSAERERWAPVALGAVLGGAGLYQFTPLKRTCLAHCRSPLAFVALHWRDGRTGALRMGLRHGVYCLGCCWALFAVLVAAGVMSVAWMLLLTLVIAIEKLLPLGQRASAGIGVGLIVLGVAVASGSALMLWLAAGDGGPG